VARTELEAARTDVCITQSELKALEPRRRLSFSPKLPTSVLLSILGKLGKRPSERAAHKLAACAKREWRHAMGTAKALGMYETYTETYETKKVKGKRVQMRFVCDADVRATQNHVDQGRGALHLWGWATRNEGSWTTEGKRLSLCRRWSISTASFQSVDGI